MYKYCITTTTHTRSDTYNSINWASLRNGFDQILEEEKNQSIILQVFRAPVGRLLDPGA